MEICNNLIVHDNIIVDDDVSINNKLDVSGVYIVHRLDVDHDVSLNKNVEIENNLYVNDNIIVQDDVSINNKLDVSGVYIVHRLDVDDDVSLNKNVEIKNNLYVNDNIIVKDDVSINNQLDVSKVHITNRLDVEHDVSFNKTLEVKEYFVSHLDMIAKRDLSVNYNIDTQTLKILGTLNVGDDASFSTNVEISNNLLVKKNINILNKLDVSGVYIDNGLLVNKDVSFNENLYIDKNLKINNNLIVLNDVSLNDRLDVSSIFIKNNLIVHDDVSFNNNLFFNSVLRDRTVLEPYLKNIGITDEGIDSYFENNIRVLKVDTITKKVYFGEVDFSGSDIRVTIDGIITDYLREKYININRDASFNSDVSFIQNIEVSNNLIVKRESYLYDKSYFYDDIYLKTSDNTGSKIIHGPSILGLDPSPYTGSSGVERGTVVVYGDLQVLGETTTVESSTLVVKDRIVRIETAPGEPGGLQIIEIDRSSATETEIASFTFIKRGNLIEWSTDENNLNIGDGIFTTSEIRAKNYREKVQILDILSYDISSINIQTNHLKLIDLSARNISDFSMIGDLNINNNNIENVTSISANQNNGYIRFNDSLYLSAGRDILMNNNSILKINRLQGYSSSDSNSSTNLVIDSRTININNNNLINVNRIIGYPITLNPGTESNILKINDLELIDKDISGVDKIYGKIIDANGNRNISVINDMSLTKITLQEISGNSNVLSINNFKNGRSVEITAPETKIDARNIYVLADTGIGSIDMKAKNININDQADGGGVMNISNFLNVNFFSQINIGNEFAPYRANMYGVVNFLNNSNDFLDICNTAINFFKPIVSHNTNIEITENGVFKGYLEGNAYNATKLNNKNENQLHVAHATTAGTANYANNSAKLGTASAGDLQVGKANRLAEVQDTGVSDHCNIFLANHIRSKNDVTAYYSDERLKEKLGKIENAIDKIKAIETFYFKENEKASEFGFNNKKRQLGISAQSVKAVVPEVITLAAFDMLDSSLNSVKEIVSKSGENYLSVDYSKLVTLLIEGIKEQQKQIDELKNEIIILKTN